MTTTDINSNELTRMKEQFSILEQRLKQEEIINERMMRRAMNDKVQKLLHDNRIMMVVALLAIPNCWWTFRHLMDMSLLFSCVTSAFLLIALSYSHWVHRIIAKRDLRTADLVDARRQMIRARRYSAQWLRFGIPFLGIWLIWFFTEGITQYPDHSEFMGGMLTGGAVGAVAGGIIGWRQYRKQKRLMQEVIDELAEYTDGENQ